MLILRGVVPFLLLNVYSMSEVLGIEGGEGELIGLDLGEGVRFWGIVVSNVFGIFIPKIGK